MYELPLDDRQKKICFYVGHSYHLKTKSTVFLKDFLAQYFIVKEFPINPDEPSVMGEVEKICLAQADIVVLFQVEFILPLIYKHCAKVICVPMYDACGGMPDSYFRMMQGACIINFSSNLHDRCLSLGLSSFHWKFFPTVHESNITKRTLPETRRLKIFFWQRGDQITLKDVIRLFPPEGGYSIHLHWARDDKKEIDKETVQLLKVYKTNSVSLWFQHKQDLLDCMSKCDLYICPRFYEGIGMGFLDAMAHGLVPVAFARPTHNEYITNWQNGILFDENSSNISIDCKIVADMRSKMILGIKHGRQAFEAEEKTLYSFILAYISCSSLSCVESCNPFEGSVLLSDVYEQGHKTFSDFIFQPRKITEMPLAAILSRIWEIDSSESARIMLKIIDRDTPDKRSQLFMIASLARLASSRNGLDILNSLRLETVRAIYTLENNAQILEHPIGRKALFKLEKAFYLTNHAHQAPQPLNSCDIDIKYAKHG